MTPHGIYALVLKVIKYNELCFMFYFILFFSNDGVYIFYFVDKEIGLNIMEKKVCRIREAKGKFSFLCL
jgi:hypothetical protein